MEYQESKISDEKMKRLQEQHLERRFEVQKLIREQIEYYYNKVQQKLQEDKDHHEMNHGKARKEFHLLKNFGKILKFKDEMGSEFMP